MSSLTVYIGHSGATLQTSTTPSSSTAAQQNQHQHQDKDHQHQHHALPQTQQITTLEALRAFIESRGGIAGQKQVLLTARGKQVRQQTLLTETDIYAFDSSLLAPPSSSAKETKRQPHLAPIPPRYTPPKPPDSITNQTDLQSWRQLFAARLQWATSLRDQCALLAAQARQHTEQHAVIEKSLDIAVLSLTAHMRGAEQKHAAAEEWSEGALKEQVAHIDHWERDLDRLAKLPAKLDFARFVDARPSPVPDVGRRVTTLQDFVEVEDVRRAAGSAKDSMTSFARRAVHLKSSLAATAKQSDELLAAVEQMHAASSSNHFAVAGEGGDEPAKLLEEIDIIVTKMSNDLSHIDSLSSNNQGVSRASKMALLHTRTYIPNLAEYCAEINDLVKRILEARNTAAALSMQHMQTLAGIESRLSQAYTDIKNLDISADDQAAFNLLHIPSRLPYVYGSLLVESVRRREWSGKMKKDSATLAEELATFQEEEARRRKKWLLSIDDVVNPDLLANAKPLGMEMNFQADDHDRLWPQVSRQDLHDYLHNLQALDLPKEVVQDLTNAIKDLDRPTRKQTKLAKQAFKNGSIHEAAFGMTSLLLRGGGEGDFKLLRDTNTKLEEELKGQKSRVRKLEDLLHRQAHMHRMTSGDSSFTPQMDLISSPDVTRTPLLPGSSGMGGPFTPRSSDDHIRQASLGSMGPGSRRTSTTLATQTEEKKLARRVVTLEAELQSAREYASTLEKDKATSEQSRKDSDEQATKHKEDEQRKFDQEASRQAQFDEAVSTKKDIMENMEAQQREFADERKVLNEELRHARERIEEFEDEMERILGSREHVESRTRELEAEVDELKREAEEERDAKGREIEELKTQIANQQCDGERLKQQHQHAHQQVLDLQSAVDGHEKNKAENTALLSAAHDHLSPDTKAPENYVELAQVLEDLARRSAAHVEQLTDALAVVKAENDTLGTRHESMSTEHNAAMAKQAVLEAEIIRLHDEMASEKAHSASLASCLDDERAQLRNLRSQFADGETGADVLRKRVEEEEGRVMGLMDKLAQVESHCNSLEDELSRMQTNYLAAQSEMTALREHLTSRGTRAKEVSQRLYAQNARLLRLLDHLGFVVAYGNDGAMAIERASKLNNTASTTLDVSTTLNANRIVSSPPPPMPVSRKTSLANANEDLDPATHPFLSWPDSQSAQAESESYASFLSSRVSQFDSTVFSEAIAKRLRDFEYTARKWSREAKTYHSKSARLAHECAQKIAVKDFKEGDLALFLPTRGERNKGAWAAFNIGAPHHFLKEREGMGLGRREWMVARISKVEERVVDLSKPPHASSSSPSPPSSFQHLHKDKDKDKSSSGLGLALGLGSKLRPSSTSLRSAGSTSVDAASFDDAATDPHDDPENPFELSDGLTWYLVHAAEDKPGAPSTPGLGKSTVASTVVDAKGSIRMTTSSHHRGSVRKGWGSVVGIGGGGGGGGNGSGVVTTGTTVSGSLGNDIATGVGAGAGGGPGEAVKTLEVFGRRSLDSRRSSGASSVQKKHGGVAGAGAGAGASATGTHGPRGISGTSPARSASDVAAPVAPAPAPASAGQG